jgi:hypothetical protein
VCDVSDKTRKRVAADQPSAAPRSEMPADDRTALPQQQPAIVSARRPRARAGNRHLLAELPEHQRRGDQADAFQEMKRQITGIDGVSSRPVRRIVLLAG